MTVSLVTVISKTPLEPRTQQQKGQLDGRSLASLVKAQGVRMTQSRSKSGLVSH